jgi:S-DNA-T family DNA segregation ATPase FtsK/SpoIIIE
MAQKNSRKSVDKKEQKKSSPKEQIIVQKKLADETLHSIWGLACMAIAILLALAGIGQAGVAGDSVFGFLKNLFGWGYILLPVISFAMGYNFLSHKRDRTIYGPTLWGALIFLVASLGIIDVLFPEQGGFFGIAAGYIKHWLGDIASTAVLAIAAAIGFLMAFDKPLKIGRRVREEDEEKDEKKPAKEKDLVITEPQQAPGVKEEEKKKGKEKEEEERDEPSVKEAIKEGKLSYTVFGPGKGAKKDAPVKKFTDYKAPPLDLLKTSVEKPAAGDLRANSNIIKQTLESFGIDVEMGEINIGPKVTRYTLRPAQGVKLSRITALNQDLALALSAHPIRIEAPIPGKPYVGIEVPNKSAAVVRLGNLISYPEFMTSGQLGFCLGRDVTGEPMFANVEKAPHMLIAGATGSGKSITLHSVLISLLYKNPPQLLKLILIDPKRVELTSYNGLPHLIAPVVTQGKKALGVFRWAINEMDRRYEVLMKAGSRDIQSYNKKHEDEPMPFIVIVVDEMADLMAAYGRDIENSIVRLAQMARATGIHLILSTQRPSVEVITGLIKANITSRIALQVASQIDSRTILDSAGAEKLLGGGDLLFVNAQLSKPKRLQGAYISEDEIAAVTQYIKKNNEDLMDAESVPFEELNADGADVTQSNDPFAEFEAGEGEEDDMLQDAIETVREAQKASASMLQRRLKLGYARAARLLDIMESKGMIGPADGAKPREVYISKDAE